MLNYTYLSVYGKDSEAGNAHEGGAVIGDLYDPAGAPVAPGIEHAGNDVAVAARRQAGLQSLPELLASFTVERHEAEVPPGEGFVKYVNTLFSHFTCSITE